MAEETKKQTKEVKEKNSEAAEKQETADKKQENKSPEKTQKEEKKSKPKKTEAVVNGTDIPVSTKVASYVCKSIKGKEIEKAISEMEEVARLKRAIPMKGEIPHRKNMMSGRYPVRAAENFIVLLKSLRGNSNVNEIENPVICEAYANMASRPMGKFGAVRKKRSHVTIKSKAKTK